MATIYELSEKGDYQVEYQVTKAFIEKPKKMLDELRYLMSIHINGKSTLMTRRQLIDYNFKYCKIINNYSAVGERFLV